MKALYYQLYTDTWGMIPYSEASDPDIVTPKFDDQATIYSSLIAGLDEAVSIIGSQTTNLLKHPEARLAGEHRKALAT